MRENLKHTDERSLWQRYRNSDETAFAELFRRYYRKLLHFGCRVSEDSALAEDCIQELMIRLWKKRAIVNDTDSVKNYLLKSYRHILFRKLRQSKSLEERNQYYSLNEDELSTEEMIIQRERSEQIQTRVERLLDHLTPRQREILYLRFYQNLTPPEIGSLLGINPQSVSNIMQRAFAKVRDIMPQSITGYISSFLTGVFWQNF